jgi:hypothetical protein
MIELVIILEILGVLVACAGFCLVFKRINRDFPPWKVRGRHD